ncbi:MAG: hypothetical protein JW829_09065 [Pirellulales bacterium]|nr:hypothetical protein [Pirellulales bacterium]
MFSRGYVQKFDLVKQWEQDGLHHAQIKALVEVEKLAKKLKGQDITTREVPYRAATYFFTD